MTSHSVSQVIRQRRTISYFYSDIPPRKTIVDAIEHARWAPNHRLTEPWRFYLLGKQTAEAIARLNADIVTQQKGPQAGAEKLEDWMDIPGWLAVTCVNSADPLQSREDYAACCCAIQNLSLYLWSEKIGVKWTTGQVTRHPQFYDLIWVDPKLETLVGLLWYGFAAEVPDAKRKPLEEILVELP